MVVASEEMGCWSGSRAGCAQRCVGLRPPSWWSSVPRLQARSADGRIGHCRQPSRRGHATDDGALLPLPGRTVPPSLGPLPRRLPDSALPARVTL